MIKHASADNVVFFCKNWCRMDLKMSVFSVTTPSDKSCDLQENPVIATAWRQFFAQKIVVQTAIHTA